MSTRYTTSTDLLPSSGLLATHTLLSAANRGSDVASWKVFAVSLLDVPVPKETLEFDLAPHAGALLGIDSLSLGHKRLTIRAVQFSVFWK